MRIDKKVLHLALASLDSDVIDLYDSESVEGASYVAASNLVSEAGDRIDDYADFFRSYLENGNPDVMLTIAAVTNTDWAYDSETSTIFSTVIATILEGIEFYRGKKHT